MQPFTELVGYAATVVGACLMVPQMYKMYATKSVEDISWGTLVLLFFNCALWLVYGFLISSPPLVFTNSIGLIVAIVQIILKRKYRSNP